MRGGPWVGFVPSQSTDCPGTSRKARRGWAATVGCCQQKLLICLQPLALVHCFCCLPASSSGEELQRKREGETQQLTPLTVTFSWRARAFPTSMTPSQPLLRPWRPSLIGHVVYQKIHFHFWETGKQGSGKTGKGSCSIYTVGRLKIFGISNQKHHEINFHFG